MNGKGDYTCKRETEHYVDTGKVSKFTDINSDEYYAPAVAWAVENKITTGTSDTSFSPGDQCTRAQIVTFLWRYNSTPSVDNTGSFIDVASGIYYAGAVSWAVQQNITKGTSDTTFSPDNTCTRAQIVTFLYRLDQAGDPVPFQLSSVPAYNGSASVTVNNNVPYFTDSDLTVVAQTHLTELDSLGRCGVAWGCLGQETIAYGERGSIGMVKPSGWHSVRYDGIVDGNYLYNRCHLLMWKASSILDDNRNLITGTRYLNIEGMLPYEEELVDMIESTGFHVLYRVTPIFEGDNLVASGVLMEAKSVEDFGKGLQFCVYAYYVQPGIGIDYATGDSWIITEPDPDPPGDPTAREYVLNTNSKKFHYPECSSVQDMKPQNKKVVTETRDELIAEGYSPCKLCNP